MVTINYIKMNIKYLMIITIILSVLVSCNQKSSKNEFSSTSLKKINEQINSIKEGDTLDLNLTDINFDKVILLSHEINKNQLRKEISSKESDNQIFTLKHGNWGIAWLKDSLVIHHIDFSPEKLMFDNVVGGDGYAIITKNELKKMLIIQNPEKFVNSDSMVLDVKVLDEDL